VCYACCKAVALFESADGWYENARCCLRAACCVLCGCLHVITVCKSADLQLMSETADLLYAACYLLCGCWQVIAVCKSADLLLMVLDATKPWYHREILTRELESVGMRLNRWEAAVIISVFGCEKMLGYDRCLWFILSLWTSVCLCIE
jgi:hypothetical protein